MNVSALVAAAIGAVSGTVAGIFGGSFFLGLVSGAITGGIVGIIFSNSSRPFGAPLIAVESFGPAGLLGGVVGSAITGAGWIGGFISCGIGFVIGQFLRALLIALTTGKLRSENTSKENYVSKSEPVTQKDRNISSELENEDRGGPRTSNKAESSLLNLNKECPSSYAEAANPKSADQLYTEALNCFPSNEEKAALLMSVAAIKGHSKAHYYYGHWFLHGWGLENDYSMAAHWLTKAADQGIHEALYDLGRMHFEGKGFPQSVSQATVYWNQASAQGNPEAQYALSKLGISSIGQSTSIVRQAKSCSSAQCPKCAAEFNPEQFHACPVCGYHEASSKP